MEFGDWVSERRRVLGFDVRSFAEKTKVDASTISRIENKNTQATLYTAFRICEGLGISFSELFRQLKELYTLPLPWDDSSSLKERKTLRIEDVENFIFKFYSNEGRNRELLANLINEISHLLSKDRRQRMSSGRYPLVEICPEDIDKMLFGSQLFEGFYLQYPLEIDANIISFTYQQKGVLIANDVEVFMRAAFVKERVEYSLLNRLQGVSLERIRLVDVLKFDSAGGYDGTIMGMYWTVCRFWERCDSLPKRLKKQRQIYEQLSLFNSKTLDATMSVFGYLHPKTSESLSSQDGWIRKLADIYVRIYRWLQYLTNNDLNNIYRDDISRLRLDASLNHFVHSSEK